MLQSGILVFLFFIVSINLVEAQQLEVKTYFDNDKKLIKEVYQIDKNQPGILNGHYQSYFPSGKVEVSGFYKGNLAIGMWTYYYYNGNPRMKGEMFQNEPAGPWKYYFENGNLSMEGPIEQGKRSGSWKFYYESGHKKSEGAFLHNDKVGVWQYYYEDETLKAVANYVGNSASYKEFYPLGGIKAIGYKKDEKSDSLWTYFYEDSNKMGVGFFEEGLKAGNWTYYHKNGVKASEGIYLDGKKNGYWKYFDEEGEMSSEGIVLENKKEGYWKLYYSGGLMKGEGHFDKGAGVLKEYYESGVLKRSGLIKDDVKEGKWLMYYESGELEGEVLFRKGRGDYTGYYETGEIKMSGAIEDDRRVGTWVLYEPDGAIAGYYNTVYNDDSFKFDNLFEANLGQNADTTNYEKPAYKFKNKKSRYFEGRLNEFRGLIFSVNPIALGFGGLPIAAEYYMQERLGYELQFALLRDPFFLADGSVKINDLYKRGYALSFKQKFYQEDRNFGMLYLGHELRFTHTKYKANAIDPNSNSITYPQGIEEETREYEYSIVLGNRISTDAGEKGLTLDLFMGVGVGYREHVGLNFSQDNYWMKNVLKDVPKAKLTVPIRLGLSVGYIF